MVSVMINEKGSVLNGKLCLVMYVYKKNPSNKHLGCLTFHLSLKLSPSELPHCGAGAALRPLGARCLELDHVQVCSGSDVFSAEPWRRARAWERERERESRVRLQLVKTSLCALRLLWADSSAAPRAEDAAQSPSHIKVKWWHGYQRG